MRMDAAADQMSGDEWIRSHPDVQVGLGLAKTGNITVYVSAVLGSISAVASCCQLAVELSSNCVLLHVNKSP